METNSTQVEPFSLSNAFIFPLTIKKKKKKKTEENDNLWTFDWPTTILFYEMVVKVVKSP
jgi:Na+/H+ antiporter NhaD/arsenite permease-like protein